MLLGKRPRPPIMKRTTSMSGGLAVDMQPITSNEEVIHSASDDNNGIKDPLPHHAADHTKNAFDSNGYDEFHNRLVMFPSPTTTNNNHIQTSRNNPAHAIHTAHFLRTCGLCNCRLAPGRDIYMYRGDTAFCSLECREKQMKQDQRKEKCKAAAASNHRAASPSTATATAASTKSETAAACT